jgi:lysophospholipase L1-like esterase
MKHPYLGLWSLLAVSFILFFSLSAFGTITIGGVELQSSQIYDELTREREQEDSLMELYVEQDSCLVEQKPEIDTLPQRILLVGDSMLEGLSPRMAAYAEHNGHTLYTVIWYGSTTKTWGSTTRLKDYIAQYEPTYVFVALGANELFVRDVKKHREKYVKNLIEQLGDVEYLWIGPPNWKEDTGINDLIRSYTPRGKFFLSKEMHFDRASDRMHPTRKAAAKWFDSIARWMPEYSTHPIKLEEPEVAKAQPAKIIIHQPQD